MIILLMDHVAKVLKDKKKLDEIVEKSFVVLHYGMKLKIV